MWGVLSCALAIAGADPALPVVEPPATVVFIPRGSGSPDGARAATAAMRDSSAEHWLVMVFPPRAGALADAFVAFARIPTRTRDRDTFRDSHDAFLVNGARFFRSVEVDRSPADEETLELWSDAYPPIVLRRFSDRSCLAGDEEKHRELCRIGSACPACDPSDEPSRTSTLPEATAYRFVPLPEENDLRPVFAGFLRSQGFLPIEDLDVGPDVKLVRTGGVDALRFAVRGGPLDGRVLDLKQALMSPERDQVSGFKVRCAVDDFEKVKSLPVAAVGVAGKTSYMRVRLSLGQCDWEAGGCMCQPSAGPGAIERLIVVPPGNGDPSLISRQRRTIPAEGPR